MAIDWPTIKPLIKKQIAAMSEVAAENVRWVDEPSGPLAGANPVVYLRVASIVTVGDDEERYEGPPSANPLDDQKVTLCGQRYFTLSIRCESSIADIAEPMSAAAIVERIKVRAARVSGFIERFGIYGIVDWLTTNWRSYVDNGRVIITYICDFKCVTVDNDPDNTEDAGSWIGEVLTASSPLYGVDGQPTASQVDLDIDAREDE